MTDVTDRTAAGEEQSTAGQVKDTVQEGMQQAKDRVQESTEQVRGQASQRLREQVDQRSTQAGEQAQTIAQAFRSTGEQLRNEGNDGPARVVDAAAQRVERVGGYLTQSDSDRILSDAEDFARRQPWLVAAGGAIVGMLAARLLKASSTKRYQQRSGRSGYGSQYYGGSYGSAPYGVEPTARELAPAPVDLTVPPVEGPTVATDGDAVI
jgi:ElaB/YqjD/DUF883 family membrane-anchored ribosome-binding protein